MRSRDACAVVATAFPEDAEAVKPLLQKAGFSVILAARDGAEALRLVRDRLPDLLLADAVLPVVEGVTLAERALHLSTAVHPATLVMTVPEMRVRTLPCGSIALDKPLAEAALMDALRRTSPECRAVPVEKRRLAEETLDTIGIPAHCGRGYLLRAIEMTWMDARLAHSLTDRLYPALASEFRTERRHVERAIRHVIDVAWRSGEIEAQYKIFGDTIDAKRGNPTCGEMIAQIADILRWEGRA